MWPTLTAREGRGLPLSSDGAVNVEGVKKISAQLRRRPRIRGSFGFVRVSTTPWRAISFNVLTRLIELLVVTTVLFSGFLLLPY